MSWGPGRYWLVATLMLATSAAAASCLHTPDPNELLTKPVIVTKRETNVDFAALSTFAMTESIPLLTSFSAFDGGAAALDAGASAMSVDPAIEGPTLDEISAQLVSRGYQRVTRTEGPDFGVAVTAVSKLNAVTVNYGGWWGYGAATGGYWGYSGTGLGTTLGYSSVIVWQSGSLIIELYDLRAARDAARSAGTNPTVAAPTGMVTIPVVWAALIHAVIGGGGATLDAPPIPEIQQAFIQSPYLVRATPVNTPLGVP